MDIHKEKHFEKEVLKHFCASGWVSSSDLVKGSSAHQGGSYDRDLALWPEDVLSWIQLTQPKMWAKLKASKNGQSEAALLKRLAECCDKDGSLSVLRHGFKDVGLKFDMCQFKPGHSMNPETVERYSQVILRVEQQVKYSVNKDNGNAIDLVFFVNGIPVATWELKTDFTQSVEDAKWQYKVDRPPKDLATNKEEPLLAFKRRSLVHFALSTDEAWMTTKLAGKSTYFLPFNLGHEEGAGNPPNPKGYKTSYLWEQVFEREALLDIVGRFVHLEQEEVKHPDTGKKSIKESMIFPRFHQWEAVCSLIDAAKAEGAGHRYLIQHSAGSGKTNSISWLSHQLASLHANNKKVFDSVIVITDRTVLDAQLQDAIYQFEHKQGVVRKIEDNGGIPKSAQLAEALSQNTPIIICTIQTFPFAMEAIVKDASAKGKSFAVVADEAHSSQTGGAAAKLKATLATDLTEVLSPERIKELEEDEDAELSADELMLIAMHGRAKAANISFFAFTATPKAKTLELFGRVPDAKQPAGEGNLPEPFHLYSMQQAIEEGFILDVLKNYTPYKMAFKLAHNGKDYSDAEVEKSTALKSLMKWVRLHPHNISQKVQVVVEHFKANIAWRLDGKAKAMIVVASRKEAVRWKVALDEYIKKQGYKNLAALVAFSGDVNDKDGTGLESVSETSTKLNPTLKGRDIRDAFDTDEFQILLVANKYQTGFDQPKLVAMYVDKVLSGVTAVQTLSRLNRTYPAAGKQDTFVLDFVNDPEEILASFKPYYRKAELLGISDPNLIHDLQTKLDEAQIYLGAEVDAFVSTYFSKSPTQAQLKSKIDPAVDRFQKKLKEAREAKPKDAQTIEELEVFRKDVGTFIRTYDFLSQIIDYADTDLEKRSIFFKHLLPHLHIKRENAVVDLQSVLMTHYNLRSLGQQRIQLGAASEDDEDGKLKPLTNVGGGQARDPQVELLSQLIQQMNTLFEGELTDADLLNYANHIRDKMLESKTLEAQAQANEKDQFGASPDFKTAMMDAVISAFENHKSMSEQVMSKDSVKEGLADLLLGMVYEGFKQKMVGSSGSQART